MKDVRDGLAIAEGTDFDMLDLKSKSMLRPAERALRQGDCSLTETDVDWGRSKQPVAETNRRIWHEAEDGKNYYP